VLREAEQNFCWQGMYAPVQLRGKSDADVTYKAANSVSKFHISLTQFNKKHVRHPFWVALNLFKCPNTVTSH